MTNIGKHFFHQHDKYVESIFKTNKVWYENINKCLNKFLKGVVVDVGNGGIFTYNHSLAKRLFAVDVSFKDIKKLKRYNNVTYICDDAKTLKSLRCNSADTVVIQFVLHHVIGSSSKETLRNIEKIFKASKRVLKKGGQIVIIETVVPSFVEMIERFLYRLNYSILNLMNKPMVFLYSKNTLISTLKKSGFKTAKYRKISYGKKIDIMNGIRPGLVVVPSFMAPHRCYFFVAKN